MDMLSELQVSVVELESVILAQKEQYSESGEDCMGSMMNCTRMPCVITNHLHEIDAVMYSSAP
jgi:hypothetical protein